MNDAISLDHTRNQWVDLGILTDVCMASPGTCGAAGGAVAFWMRITCCVYDNVDRGIISSLKSDMSKQNFRIYSSYRVLR